jgi:Na+/H+-dicarboxylate symporter
MEQDSVLKSFEHYLRGLVEAQLWVKVLVALALGLGVGMAISPITGWVSVEVSTSLGSWLALPGKLFLKLVQMIMIPLIFTSIISGIVANTSEQLKSMGLKLLVYFIASTTVAIAIGIFLAMLFKPGASIYSAGAFALEPVSAPLQQGAGGVLSNVPHAISELLPANPLAAMVTGEMLSIVIFTIIIGIAITQLERSTINPLMKLFHGIQEICMTVVNWAMRLVPYAVFGLIAQLTSSIGLNSMAGIGFYIGVVLLGLLVLLGVYLLILGVFGHMKPLFFLKQVRDVQLLAFSTTSSAAVMPLTMKTAEEKLGVRASISNFIIPVGATINMDGTALFQCVSVIFIAQSYGMEITLVNLVLIMVTIIAASIGTPAIPGGGVVILASVLQSAGIPTEGLVIIIGVERILGMFRTAINVTGDLVACVLFDRIPWLNKLPA